MRHEATVMTSAISVFVLSPSIRLFFFLSTLLSSSILLAILHGDFWPGDISTFMFTCDQSGVWNNSALDMGIILLTLLRILLSPVVDSVLYCSMAVIPMSRNYIASEFKIREAHENFHSFLLDTEKCGSLWMKCGEQAGLANPGFQYFNFAPNTVMPGI